MATCPKCRSHYADDVKTCAADGEVLLPDQAFSGVEPDLAAGSSVGEYRIEAKIGEGGFGSVYRAVHPLIGKTAAVKVLNRQYSSNPQMVSRFIAEARAVNQIRNRNIIDIFSFGALDDGRQYYVMELLEGMTMSAYLKSKGRLSPEELLPIARGIARALDAAHAAGIAHRDLKPENVFLVFEEDGVVFPKLLDFGIAKLLGESMSGHKTRTGTPMGTPHYMSPEQCRGRSVDHRTDLYSFGILLFESLSGKVPFDGADIMDILIKHTNEAAPSLASVCPEVPAALDAPIRRFLEKDPAQRPESLGAGLDALAVAAKDAGFDVKLPAKRGPEASLGAAPAARSTVQSSPGLTPPDVDKLVTAPTMVQAEPAQKTLLPTATDVRPAASKAPLLVGAVLVAAVVGGAVFWMRGGSTPPAPAEATVKSSAPPPASATAAPAETEKAVATASAAPSAPASAAASPEVELSFEGAPKGTDVYLDGAKAGTTAAPIRVKRGDGKVKLTFKAAGYKDQDVEVSAAAPSVVSVKLAPAGKSKGKRNDLEF